MQVRLRYLILGLVAVGVPVGIAGAAPASADCVNAGPAAAELHGRRSAGVMSGASAATSAYLFTHPDVNGFFTGLRGQPKDQIRAQVQEYLDQPPKSAPRSRASGSLRSTSGTAAGRPSVPPSPSSA